MKKIRWILIAGYFLMMSLALGVVIFIIVSISLDKFDGLAIYYLALALSILGFIVSPLLTMMYRQYSRNKDLINENNTKFGVSDFLFPNRNIFLDYLNRRLLKKKLNHSALIAFQLFSDSQKYQHHQMEQIRDFHLTIAQYIVRLNENRARGHKFFYGMSGHAFFLFVTYENEDELKSFLTKLDNDFYDLASFKKVQVNMHPTFGIYLNNDSTRLDRYDIFDEVMMALRHGLATYQVFVYYSQELASMMVTDEAIEKEIIRGIKEKEFKVFYQAKYDLQSKRFCGAEALVRWQHPNKGLLGPSAFIGECEKSGLIHILDFYVFNQVCQDLGDWKRRGRRMLPISINFSSYDFYRPDFVDTVLKTIEQNGISPNFIEIEITESSTAANFLYVSSVLQRLQEENVRILMDDFGTGFSSLANLRDYAIDCIKIDQTFIQNLGEDIKEKEIVASIISLARSLGLTTIAEGVQTQKQVEILTELKCNQVQGYYYSKPISKKDFEKMLSNNEFEKKGMLL